LVQAAVIESPFNNLADLFLDGLPPRPPTLSVAGPELQKEQTFCRILDNNIKSVEPDDSTVRSSSDPVGSEEERRRTSLEEFEAQVEDLGLPLNSLKLNPKDLPKLRRILEDSGVKPERINELMERLAQGPLTMDRVLAVLHSEKAAEKSGLILNEEARPLLGRFLQDLGLGSEKVKEILAGLEPGQRLGPEALRQILLTQGRTNLKGMTLAKADLENLNDLLKSLGVEEKHLKGFWAAFKQTNGRMSMEGFLGFLKSLERPERLTREQAQHIKVVVQNLILENSLQARVYFDRTSALLQSLGDRRTGGDPPSRNPAIQVLRGGAEAARSVMDGTGALGRSSSNDAETGGGFGSLADKGGAGSSTSRSVEPGLPSRLSESVLRQVTEKMVYLVRNNQHRLRVNLDPPELGRINLNLIVRNNEVRGSIITEKAAVKEALEAQLVQLRENLAQQGLHLESFDIRLHQEPAQADLWDRDRRLNRSDRKKAADSEQISEDAVRFSEHAGPRSLIDTIA